MRFRFTAETRDGEERAGYLTADDRDNAARQLERRGLTVRSLEDAAEVLEASPTVRMPSSPPLAVQRASVPDWRQQLAGLDFRRLGLAALVLLMALSGLAWALRRLAAGNNIYHLKLTGSCIVQTRRTLAKDYWKRVRPRLWLPKPQWYVSSRGVIYARGKDGKWGELEQRAKVDYQGSNEGNYTLDIELALTAPPEGATLDFSARGYSRARKQVVFKSDGKVYTCQVPSMVLSSRWRRGANRRGQSTRGDLKR